jgi:hypothetical protein
MRWAVNRENQKVGPYNEAVAGMELEDIRRHFLEPEVQDEFAQ